jgi:hypothetical protein
MLKTVMHGFSEANAERFDFEIDERPSGFALSIRHSGYGQPRLTGAGIWPTVEKAQAIAVETVERLLGECFKVTWESNDAR